MRRERGRVLFVIQLKLHKEWCTWKIDLDTVHRQILLIMQYLNTQNAPLNGEKKPRSQQIKSFQWHQRENVSKVHYSTREPVIHHRAEFQKERSKILFTSPLWRLEKNRIWEHWAPFPHLLIFQVSKMQSKHFPGLQLPISKIKRPLGKLPDHHIVIMNIYSHAVSTDF